MLNPPIARNVGEEVKKLGLSEDKKIDLMIKFSHKLPYGKYFWKIEWCPKDKICEKKLWDCHSLCTV